MRYWDSSPHNKIAEIMKALDNMKNAWLDKLEISWGIFLKSSQQLIGKSSLHSLDSERHKAQIGYIINPKYWRNGFASEALQELIR